MRVNPINKSDQSRMHKEIENTYEYNRKRRANEESVSFFDILEQMKKNSSGSIMKNSVKKKIV